MRKNTVNGPEYRTGRKCAEAGCGNPAGTVWSPLWCRRHNAERIDRINKQFGDIGRFFRATEPKEKE